MYLNFAKWFIFKCANLMKTLEAKKPQKPLLTKTSILGNFFFLAKKISPYKIRREKKIRILAFFWKIYYTVVHTSRLPGSHLEHLGSSGEGRPRRSAHVYCMCKEESI